MTPDVSTKNLTIAIAGDVMLGRLVNEAIARKGFSYPWGNLLPVLQEADIFLVNLECALTARAQPWHDGEDKAFYFRAVPSVAETLRIGRVDFASVANNHSCDFGTEGMAETVAVLDQAGIAHAGAGADLAAASEPAFLTAKGVRVGVVAFADYPLAWAASPNAPGINYTPISLDPGDFTRIEEALATARQQADLVIFSIHWGPNMSSRPTDLFRQFARRVMDAGADIFWGHSAHVVQGIEVFQGKPILYDTGDFVDDYAVDDLVRNNLSALFRVQVGPTGMERIDLVPVYINDMQVNLAPEPERAIFLKRLTLLCDEMGTALERGPDTASVRIA
ncbi:MAG TPA: CapA family protein [Dehalococcoidia bacterium]|nr:CapA family protein [Dehalococcoidia bacterium]